MSHDDRPGDLPVTWPRATGLPTFRRTPVAGTLDDVDVGVDGA